ncbi:hypothetical protein ACKI1I_18045 [Streptomyces turgidiscabies]|uniref:Uncharacterized protein n=1 Tax=Streptomyces turgidiscabies (strain Car8) TaxID=698760 RepID=L7ER52_STRT8|nr:MULTISPECIES: hypothetical protein [Streptomyces]ELP61384.1 hypothetical protein STRTUCAR8_07085 [Streptomyces turgidiscabies Car8]MDX3497979.1 hypothetical protein [Streptomyces turgidiscabies]GAQ69888.1 hypothetical protein T45_01619 [Streptomyces turgidiscabies]
MGEATPGSTGSEIFRSDRHFEVWQYAVGHRRLLLRSSRDRPPDTRIEIYFANVDLMLLRPGYDGLVIRRADDEECEKVSRDHGAEVKPGRLYLLGGDLRSFVVSAPPQWHEDEGAMDDPSWFGPLRGTR